MILTASDFGRTLASNGQGTDHAWAGHHLILGGGVKGGCRGVCKMPCCPVKSRGFKCNGNGCCPPVTPVICKGNTCCYPGHSCLPGGSW